jgi:hypothetical protein
VRPCLRCIAPRDSRRAPRADPIIDVVADWTRQLLFTLSRGNCIQAFDIQGGGTQLLCTISGNHLVRSCVNLLMAASLPHKDWQAKEFRVVALAAVPNYQAKSVRAPACTRSRVSVVPPAGQVAVVAVTNHGHRIYLGNEVDSLLRRDGPRRGFGDFGGNARAALPSADADGRSAQAYASSGCARPRWRARPRSAGAVERPSSARSCRRTTTARWRSSLSPRLRALTRACRCAEPPERA